MPKTKTYIVTAAQNIQGAWRAVGDSVELTAGQAKYIVGQCVELAKTKKPKSSGDAA